MNKYDFVLTPAYCLFNGIGISEQNGSYIRFMIQNAQDEVLKERLKRAFGNHIINISKIEEYAGKFLGEPIVEFEKTNRNQIRKYVSSLYTTEYKNEMWSRGAESFPSSERTNQLITKENVEIKRTNNDEAAAVLLLDRILTDGRNKNATDIHIEDKSIRFRINGQLQKQMSVSGKRYSELIQRIKLLSGMNVLEKQKSQDGHFVYGGKKPLFIRTSSVYLVNETYEGNESIVLRLLDTSRIPLDIDNLGFNENQLERIGKLQEIPHGLILICGPTGSGKSTTVASILVEMEKKFNARIKIISLEDPPEYVIPGVSQIKIENNKKSFHDTLNHIFRLDPDVIMIGEIRDEESANAALKASLTGHLVFATLHTGSVSESILRMENFGLNRKMLCSVLKGVICQELSFVGKEMKLYADVGIPKDDFGTKITKEMVEDELDELFIHETNYGEVFSKTLEIFSNRNYQIEKREIHKKNLKGKKVNGVWKKLGKNEGLGEKNGKVYKRIV